MNSKAFSTCEKNPQDSGTLECVTAGITTFQLISTHNPSEVPYMTAKNFGAHESLSRNINVEK